MPSLWSPTLFLISKNNMDEKIMLFFIYFYAQSSHKILPAFPIMGTIEKVRQDVLNAIKFINIVSDLLPHYCKPINVPQSVKKPDKQHLINYETINYF
jgi:hypothetical protein